MSMNVGNASGEGEVMVEMNTTPLIDVMLVLLTLLIITLPIQTHAVKLDMPQGQSAAAADTARSDRTGRGFRRHAGLERNARPDRETLDNYLKIAAKLPIRSPKSICVRTGWPNMTPWRGFWAMRNASASRRLVSSARINICNRRGVDFEVGRAAASRT